MACRVEEDLFFTSTVLALNCHRYPQGILLYIMSISDYTVTGGWQPHTHCTTTVEQK